MSGCELCPALRVTFSQKYWISSRSVGGSERGVDRMSKALNRLGVPVTILTCGGYARDGQRSEEFSNKYRLDIGRQGILLAEIPSMPEITDIIVSSDPKELGVLHMVWGFEHYPESLSRCLKIDGVPKIFSTMEINQFEQITQELENPVAKQKHVEQMCKKVDCLVAISDPLAQEARELGFPDVRTIYLPVPVDIFTPATAIQKNELRRRSNLPIDKKCCFFAGRITKDKGIDMLMDGFTQLSLQRPNDWRLIIAGGLDLDDELERRFSDFVNRPDVKYLGVITSEQEIANYMRLSDVFVYPSVHTEGLALSVAEAMACGLPVVTTEFATSKTGMKDLVIPGETGITFDSTVRPGQAICDALSGLDKDLVTRLGVNARDKIFKLRMDDSQVGVQLRDLYCELLNKYGRCYKRDASI